MSSLLKFSDENLNQCFSHQSMLKERNTCFQTPYETSIILVIQFKGTTKIISQSS